MRGGRLFLLLGVVVAAVAALGLLYFMQTQPPPTVPTTPTPVPRKKVVAARIDIPANTVLTDTESYLILDEIPEPEYTAAPKTYFTGVEEMQNKVTLRAIKAANVLRAEDVTEAGLSVQIPAAQPNQPRPKAVAFQVSNLTGVADLIKPGDYVDLIASFDIPRTILVPSVTLDPTTGREIINISGVDLKPIRSTKALVQNVQVLKILKPPVDIIGTPTPAPAGGGDTTGAPAEPQTDQTGQPVTDGQQPGGTGGGGGTTIPQGSWTLILAVTDEQAEIIRFTMEQSKGYMLVLRGRGDSSTEQTIGVTLDLLISQYGLPLPEPIPLAPVPIIQLTPGPTQTPTPVPTQ